MLCSKTKYSTKCQAAFLYLRYYFQKLFKLGFFFIGKFADKLDKLLLLFAEAPLRKSTLIVGQPCDIIKAYVIIFCKHYGTFKGDLGFTVFISAVILCRCVEIMSYIALFFVAVLSKVPYPLIICHDIHLLDIFYHKRCFYT